MRTIQIQSCSTERSRTVFTFWLNTAKCVVYMQCALIIHSLFDNNNDVYGWFGPFHTHYISLESAATKVSNIPVTKEWNVATLTWGPLDPKKPATCSFPNGLKRVKFRITTSKVRQWKWNVYYWTDDIMPHIQSGNLINVVCTRASDGDCESK